MSDLSFAAQPWTPPDRGGYAIALVVAADDTFLRRKMEFDGSREAAYQNTGPRRDENRCWFSNATEAQQILHCPRQNLYNRTPTILHVSATVSP